MRLIDVSVLKEWVENWFTKNRFYHPYAKNNNIPITELYDILEQMPTIEERKTGRWEKQRETYCSWECSVCKEIVVAMPERMGYPMYDYCPNCGARMENK